MILLPYFDALREIAAFTFRSIFEGQNSVWGLVISVPILAGVFVACLARKIVDVMRRI